MDCPYAEKRKSGVAQYMFCTAGGGLCGFSRMCRTKGTVVNTEKAETCKIRLSKREEQ